MLLHVGTIIIMTIGVFGSEPLKLLHAESERFQNALQQQTFQNVLSAIEQRLRNLDNIYSMQLSETIQSKLDQYHRKLDSLDMKLIRLESMVSLNLDRMSENISAKNYKDDVEKTRIQRRLDGIYDGLVYRINYVERKVEMSFDRILNKMEAVGQRLEKMEDDMMQRNGDIETELSETLSVMEEHKSAMTKTDRELVEKIGKVLNETVYESMQTLNHSLATQLNQIQASNADIFVASKGALTLLEAAKSEIKADFNAYANKVADMNVDLWNRNGNVEDGLKTIEIVLNVTRNEMQNGFRSTQVQIGKLAGKGIANNDKGPLEALRKSVNLSLEKIMTNQELFLESCHRLQMDESQIESEISGMLGKLIDMLETKMTTVMKDLKTIEKSVKNYDSRHHRNLNQANTNIISLFEKTTKSHEFVQKELDNIKFYVSTLWQDLPQNIDKLNYTFQIVINASHIDQQNVQLIMEKMHLQLDEIKNLLLKLQGRAPLNQATPAPSINCSGNYADLIDIRTVNDCVNLTEHRPPVNQTTNLTKGPSINCSANYPDLIDIRMTKDCANLTQLPENDLELQKSILEVYGTPPVGEHATVAQLIDVRYDRDKNGTKKSVKGGKRRRNNKVKLRFGVGESEAIEEQMATTTQEGSMESTTTE